VREKNRFLVFGQPLIEESDIREVERSLRAAWPGTGPKVARFESLVSEYKGVKHAIAVSSCTAGLHLSCLALELEPGDEVITTPLTFCATANAIIHAGGTPVLADIDPHTMNIDPAEIRKRINSRTKALLPVHYGGRPCEMSDIMAIARQHELRVVEDCAHAIETTFHGRHAGTFGDCGVLSFYSTKNVTTGEGGMILTNDDTLAEWMKLMSQQGMSDDAWQRFSASGYKHYEVVEVGFKYNMMDLQAALGIHQMRRVTRCWHRREELWNRYNEGLAGLPVELPPEPKAGTRHALHLYTILVGPERCGVTRDELIVRLHAQNIGAGVHYRQVADQPVYQKRFGWRPEEWPNAEKVSRQTISLPFSAKLSDSDVEDVIDAVWNALGRRRRKRTAETPHTSVQLPLVQRAGANPPE
jgi:dTDP-4-amino-4,6-dideoxygalactose transaminase